ncbi:unnamed protein product [Rhizophagus irregularis]|nr:unnamed protein product [Rhizophagus irregularis]
MSTSIFAIKKFVENSNNEEIINEIHLTGMVNLHPNIIQFYGVTKLKDEINYSLVLEYAEGGTLGKYLRDNIITFKWESQLKFAKEISSAISWLHIDKGIIHGDLHPNNILIQKDTIKLADFGRSFLKGSDSNTDDIRGSDILNGKRENPISNTNDIFVALYKKCWEHEPGERPDIQQVISEIINIETIKLSNNFYFEEIETTENLDEDSNLPSCDDYDINSDKYKS